jgi:hypothetical protein
MPSRGVNRLDGKCIDRKNYRRLDSWCEIPFRVHNRFVVPRAVTRICPVVGYKGCYRQRSVNTRVTRRLWCRLTLRFQLDAAHQARIPRVRPQARQGPIRLQKQQLRVMFRTG